MADYGVNIKVNVQGQNNARQLGEQIREIVSGLEAADRAFTQFSNNLKSFDQRRAQRKINEELDKTAQKYRELDRLQRQLLANDNSAIKSAERRAKLEEFISNNISAGRVRRRSAFLLGNPNQYPSGANQPFAPNPMVAIRKQRDAEAKFAREIFDIEQDFARRHNNTQIELLTQRIKREMDLQEDAFQNALRLDKAFMKDHDRRAKAAFEARGQQNRLTGQTSPIGGAVGIPGSPAALAAAARAQRIKSAQGSALIGGAFPLLFGQGVGASMGGAMGGFGGGMIGGEFGFGLSLVGTQLGTMFDQLISKAGNLANSLNTTGDILSGLEEAGFRVSDATKGVIASYEEAGLLADAYSLAIEELNRVLGPDGADKLHAYKTETEKLNDEFEKVSAALQAELIPALTGVVRLILGVKGAFDAFASTPLGKGILNVNKAAATVLPGVGPAMGAFSALQQLGAPTGPAQKSEAQRLAEEEASMGKLITQQALNKAAKEQGYLIAAQIDLAKVGNDLLDKDVVAAKEKVIQETFLVEMRKEGITAQEMVLAGQRKELALAQLNRSVNDAERAQREKERQAAERAAKKAARAADRLDKKKQREIERAVKGVDRELERTDKAFERASSQLDAITQKHEDKMAFEREYSRLIEEGSTPAAAKQAVELKKQLLELDRQYAKLLDAVDAQILKTEASIADLKAQAGVTEEYERQVKALEDFKKKRDELEEKKGKAKGAITKDLAPETGRDKIEAEMKRVQGALNDLIDPANQVILAAQAIGDAFSESFKGLITGSMSAQEALANLFSRTADHFADMAAEMIAHAIKMQIMGIALNFFGSAAAAGAAPQTPALKTGSAFQGTLNPPGQFGSGPGFASPSTFAPPQVGDFKLPSTMAAEGGYVSGPTRALIGEGGESEYIIPASKMRESMARYSRGARGSSVIPETGASGTSGEGGGTAVAAPIDVRYTVERINNVDYVTADQFQTGMRQAANQGAKQGEQQTLKRLQLSSGTRKRLGM